MRVFTRRDQDAWGEKINFADENNLLVGFDNDGCCCEKWGYFFSSKPEQHVGSEKEFEMSDEAVAAYSFVDEEPKKYGENAVDPEYGCSLYDGGMAVQFRLRDDTGNEAYLVLYNIHNGYYSHGFTFHRNADSENKELIQEGYL